MTEPRRPSPVRWQPPLRRDRRDRARRWLAATAAGLALVGLAAGVAAVDPAPRLIWNPSASAPVGLWRIHPEPVRVGDMALARTPVAVRRLAAERRYLPMNVPLLKRVAAADGDVVCALGPWLFVNGDLVATRRQADRRGRPLPWWRGCRTLDDDTILLLMDAPDSFDGRYFGPVSRSSVIGRATPLWLR
ncbi:S26 family signal peptidase [Brevundimonas sp. SORGH_AS_0993]|uniref:S26 family signal peptidase n=1 Tax=Brevundimonas sp. SORGH_AS_0993 TaxID=3041794 RepID=UPI00277DFED4|nr:S26 family signal peptidase [Brevundimonas sp. SORGH_AS_0993]MDQ1153435.1 conjugative transfer signal peptidase TraF [Brevundimonas sp. SORGH_AS_0993]